MTNSNFNRRAVLTGSGAAMAAMLTTTAAPAQTSTRARGAAPTATSPVTSTRKIGPFQVSPLGLGCMNMAPRTYNPAPDPKAMVRLIRDAHGMGVTFFDTAEVYGPFISEEIVGEALQPIRNQVTLATKFGFELSDGSRGGRNSNPAYLRQRVEGMLKRLRTDHIDLLYLHRVDPKVPVTDVAGLVGDLIKQGKVRAFGLSEVNPDTLRSAHRVTPVSAVQSEYSMLERLPEVAMLDLCAELDTAFVPWGPTMRGLLSDGFNEFTRFAEADRRSAVPFFTPDALVANMKVVGLAREWAQRKDATPVQIALAWLLAERPHIVPIPGTTRWPHLKENMGALDVRFAPAELKEFRTALEAIPVIGARERAKAFQNE